MQQQPKIEEMFQIGIDLAEKVVAKMNSLNASDEEEFVYKGSMFFFFCKAYKSYQAIRVLWREGFAEDALIIARTIFELALQGRYMQEDPKPRARLFVEHDPVVRYRYYQKLKRSGDTIFLPAIESRTQELSELKQQHDRLKAKYPENKGWWGQSIAWLAKHLGKNMETQYATIYWIQSNLVHSGSPAAKEYMKEDQGALKINCYPTPSDQVMIPLVATLSFLGITGHTAEALDLGIHDDVTNTLDEFKKIADAVKK